MPIVEDTLRALADHPPAAPRPDGEITSRARRRSRRRRTGRGLAAVMAVMVVAAGAVALMARADETTHVTVRPDRTAPSSRATQPDPPLVPAGGQGMAITPAVDLVDGAEVTVTLDPPAGPEDEVLVTQCRAAIVEQLGTGDVHSPMDWCADAGRAGPGEPIRWTVRRVLHTVDGPTDCAVPGSCLLVARVGSATSSDDRFIPLAFDQQVPPLPEPEVVVQGIEGEIVDGQVVTITVTGSTPNGTVRVAQCRAEPLCYDGVRGRAVTLDAGGSASFPYTVFHDVLDTTSVEGWEPPWVRCEPCLLQVSVDAQRVPLLRAPITVTPTDDPIRPRVTTEPMAPLPPGGLVTLRGEGFQPDSDQGVSLFYCRADRNPGLEPACVSPPLNLFPSALVGWPTDSNGSFVVESFPLPEADASVLGADCEPAPGTCLLAWQPGEGTPYAVTLPLDLTG